MKRTLLSMLLCGALLLSCVGVLPVTAAEIGNLDVDGDGTITSTDARLVELYAMKKVSPSDDVTPDKADANGDGQVTVTDARIILQYYAQVIKEISDVRETDGGALAGDFFTFSEPTFNTLTNEITITVMYDIQKQLLDGVFYVSYPTDKLELAVVEESFPRDPYNHLSSMSNPQVNIAWDEGVVAVGFMDVKGEHHYSACALEMTFRAKTPEALTCPISVWADYMMAVANPNDLRQAVRYTGSREQAVTAQLAVPAITITPPTQRVYAVGEELNLEDSCITYTYPDGTTETQGIYSNMLSSFDSSKPGIQTVTITCGNASVTFEVEVVEPVVVYIGDVDLDRLITSTDARIVLQYYAGKFTKEDVAAMYDGAEDWEEVFHILADADEDGAITSTDARLILQYYAGKI